MSDEGDQQERPGQSPYAAPQVESVLREVRDLIEQARPMPVSRSVMINQIEVLDLIDEAVERLPEELRAAKWLLKQREEFLARTRREADDIIEAAHEKADQLVTQTEVVKAAEARARSVVDAADAEARRLKLEAEDFCDQRLASFEIVLERTMKVVNAGRVKLQSGQSRDEDDEPGGDQGGPGGRGGHGGHGGAGGPSGGEETFDRPHLEAVPDQAPAFFNQDES